MCEFVCDGVSVLLLIRLGEFEVDQELRGLELSLFVCLGVLLTTIDSFLCQ